MIVQKMSATTVVETTKNPVVGQKGVSAVWGTSVSLWFDSSSLTDSAHDQIEVTKVTGGQYWEGTLGKDLDLTSKQKILEVAQLKRLQTPTLFTLVGVTFFAISGYFIIQNVFDLGVASL